MARIEWNKPGERFFEAGLDRGVFYPKAGSPGVPWNGLVSVTETSSGGEVQSFYYDGVKYMDLVANEDFSATLEAFSSPKEFSASDGVKQLSPGLYATQQPRQTFGLSYRTLVGNDLEGEEYAYQLHLVYNVTAAPSDRSSKTLAGTPDPATRTWSLTAVPPAASTFKPTAHIVIHSDQVDPATMAIFEEALYGDDQNTNPPTLPTLPNIIAFFAGQ